MTWTAPTPSPVDGPLTGDDRPILEGYLNWERTTLLNICAGLTGEQLADRPIPRQGRRLRRRQGGRRHGRLRAVAGRMAPRRRSGRGHGLRRHLRRRW